MPEFVVVPRHIRPAQIVRQYKDDIWKLRFRPEIKEAITKSSDKSPY
jgi:hypothetical protein